MGERPSFFTPENPLPTTDLQRVIDTENDIIDQRSDAFYAANLFNTEVLIAKGMYDPWHPESPINRRFEELDRRFRYENAAATDMLGHLKLFLDYRYFPYLDSLDLDKTRNVNNPAILDHMVHEYRDICDWAVRTELTGGELPREESGREVYVRPHALMREGHGDSSHEAPEWSIGVRNRPLLRFVHLNRVVMVTKRMTFALPTFLAEELAGGPFDHPRPVTDRNALEYIEHSLDEHEEGITGVRTLYYVMKNKPATKGKPKG